MRSTHKLGQLSAGQVLAADGLISPEQIQELAVERLETSERVTDIAIARGLVTEFDVAKAMVRHLLLPFVNPMSYDIPDEVLGALPVQYLRQHRIVPLDRFANCLVIATCGDLSSEVVREIETLSGGKVGLFIAQRSEIERVLDERYPAQEPEKDVGSEVASRLDQIFGE